MGEVETAGAIDDVWRETWGGLVRATRDRRHAFRHPVVATHHPGLGVRARTVVLREADPRGARLTLHSDVRSGKLEALEHHPAMSWCFYDARRRIQVRAETRAVVHVGDAVARAAWQRQGAGARALFAVEPAPGTPLGDRETPTPPADDDAGFAHFAVVVGSVEELDWLHLGREAHRRIRFEPVEGGEGGWRGTPVVP